ncbi:hypothetical protein B7P43_G03521 [Cryptotermes secundus]|uniref:Histone-lysine N-methyltransferase SETMAR n=1 Tax=Cryptotermes secundus TaxID=105785 RepID=A0A2J7R549_9NEOP|nr:hypothetical protein B7P43_G03521 [Cryptotermes secundus]
MIRFLWLEGVSGAEIHCRLSAQYGDSALPRRSVYERVERFKIGRRSVTHEGGAAHPSTSTTDEKIQQAREMELANRRVTIDEIADLLTNNLKPAIRTKRRGLLSKKVLLLHDSARPRMAGQTVETINHLDFEVLEHPAYSPDLAPSDYHLFGPLRNALRSRQFSTDQVVLEAVHKLLRHQPKPSSWREYAIRMCFKH